jgi:HEAT repeat protein
LPSLNELLAALTSRDENRAEAAAVELAELGEDAVPRLLQLLRSDEADDRWWALRTLAGLEAPDASVFRAALEDQSSEVQAAAALGLAAHPDPEAMPALLKLLADEDNTLASLAGRALTMLGQPVVPSLIEAYHSAPPRARIQIMRTLAQLKDHRAIALMLSATEESSAAVDYWAKVGLESLGLNMVYINPE